MPVYGKAAFKSLKGSLRTGYTSTPTPTPTSAVRSSSMTYVNNADNAVLPLPTGSLAGDLMVIFTQHGYGINNLSGWTRGDISNGSNCNGATFYKTLTSGDITAGSVTVTYQGSYYGTAIGVTFVGAHAVRNLMAQRNSAGASTRTTTSDGSPLVGDTIVEFASGRNNTTITNSPAGTTLQTSSQNEASAVTSSVLASVAGAQSFTATFPGVPNGDYESLFVVAP